MNSHFRLNRFCCQSVFKFISNETQFSRHFSSSATNDDKSKTTSKPTSEKISEVDNRLGFHPNTPLGRMDRTPKKHSNEPLGSNQTNLQEGEDPFAPFEGRRNPRTGEVGGPTGPEPTRYGDWERKGRVSDF